MMDSIAPSPEDLYDLAAYDALMWALARPGRVQEMPETGFAPVIRTLLDRECAVFVQNPALMPQVARTGARIAELGDADHVFLGPAHALGDLAQVRTGSDLYPDEGASVFLEAGLGQGTALRLIGPGVEGHMDARIALPPGFWDARAKALRYPMGFDLFVIDGARVLGLPRSTMIEVL